MAIATLAWNLICWLALSLTESGPTPAKEKRCAEKQRLLRMDLSTFRQSLILIPTQIIRTSRRLISRVLSWSSSLKLWFRLHDGVRQPLRC